MKWVANKTDSIRSFIIEHDEAAGFYVYVYENDVCVIDDLQDTLYWAKQVALEEFNIQPESWRLVED